MFSINKYFLFEAVGIHVGQEFYTLASPSEYYYIFHNVCEGKQTTELVRDVHQLSGEGCYRTRTHIQYFHHFKHIRVRDLCTAPSGDIRH
jgi:hypothetical protein